MANVLKNDFSGFDHAAAGQKVCFEARQQFKAAQSRFGIFVGIISLLGIAVITTFRVGSVVYGTVQALLAAALIWWVSFVAPTVVRLHRAHAQLRAVEHGLAGELAVAKVLAEGLDEHYYIINDLTLAIGEQETQVDHIVVSPCAVWCIETKNWHGSYRPGATGWLWEPLSRHSGKPRWHKDPQLQSEMHSKALKEYLSQQGITAPVLPIVVLANQSA